MATILIVEDYEPLRALYRKSLHSLGLHTIQAGDCDDALVYLRAGIPDVAVLDISLYDVNGLRVINYLVDQERFVDTQLVTISRKDQYGTLAHVYCIRHCLLKPVSTSTLTTLVKRLTTHNAYSIA